MRNASIWSINYYLDAKPTKKKLKLRQRKLISNNLGLRESLKVIFYEQSTLYTFQKEAHILKRRRAIAYINFWIFVQYNSLNLRINSAVALIAIGNGGAVGVRGGGRGPSVCGGGVGRHECVSDQPTK